MESSFLTGGGGGVEEMAGREEEESRDGHGKFRENLVSLAFGSKIASAEKIHKT